MAWFKDDLGKRIGDTFLYFWSVSCRYCKEILSTVWLLYKEVKNHTKVICVHVPLSENSLVDPSIEKVIYLYNIEETILLDNGHKLFSIFKTGFFPTTLFK